MKTETKYQQLYDRRVALLRKKNKQCGRAGGKPYCYNSSTLTISYCPFLNELTTMQELKQTGNLFIFGRTNAVKTGARCLRAPAHVVGV